MICNKLLVLLIIILNKSLISIGIKNLKSIYEWKYIDYLWKSNEDRENFIQSKKYNFKNIVPIDVDVAKGRYLMH